jgi:hypothetical protein
MDLDSLLADGPAPAKEGYTKPLDLAAQRLADHEKLRKEMEENFHAYNEVQKLSATDKDALLSLLLDAQAGDADALKALNTFIYEEVPVSMEEFLLGKRYMGLEGRINPEKIEILTAFDQPHVRTGWFAVGSGGGKGFSVSCMMSRQVYKLLCLRRPDLFYLLGPGSQISIINLSVAKDQAKAVVFNEFMARVKYCPWLANKYKESSRQCFFPKGVAVLSGGSAATSYYGYHTIMGTIDEAAFMVEGERDLAEDLIEALRKSMHTRFPNAYKLMIISTLRAQSDFVNVNIERIKAEGVRVK